MEQVEYVVGGEVKLKDFILPSLEGKYKGHPDLDKSGFVLIPVRGNGDYYWAERALVQERYFVKYGARGPVHYVKINENEKELFPSTRGGLVQ
jgi:hypothetical protein